LINLKQRVLVVEHIDNFKRLNIKVIDIPKEHLTDIFIMTLRENIQHKVFLVGTKVIGERVQGGEKC